MADSASVIVRAIYTKSGQTRAYFDTEDLSRALTPDEGQYRLQLIPASAYVLIAANEFTAITQLIIRNNDSSNYVQLGYTDTESNAQDPIIGAGGIMVIPSIDATVKVDLAADTAACLCDIVILGT